MRYQRQHDANDCGPACLAMVASRYKYFITIGELRALCKTDILGTNLAGMASAVSKIGFKAVALQGEVKDTTLNAKLLFPCIAHVKTTYTTMKRAALILPRYLQISPLLTNLHG